MPYKIKPGDELTAKRLNQAVKGFGIAEQAPPDLTLHIESGCAFFGDVLEEWAGGNSPSFTAPVANPRIDLLVFKDDGTLERIAGDEGAIPVAPTIPLDKYPICQVYNRVDQTSIKEIDDSTNGYVQKDLRAEVGCIKDVGKDSEMVKLAGNQTVAGIKTFSSIPVLPASDPTTDNQAARKKYVDERAPTLAFVDTQVHNDAAPTAWADLDLSAVVGSNRALVFLKLHSGSGTPETSYVFREKGESTDIDVGKYGASATIFTQLRMGYVLVFTDTLGKVQWKASANTHTYVTVRTYLKL